MHEKRVDSPRVQGMWETCTDIADCPLKTAH